MAAKKKSRERLDDTAFKTQGTDVGEVKDLIEKELSKISFDAHFVTSKTMEFGKILTGIPLYSYQEMIAYRIIYAIITLENTTITMLLSRQSGKSETLAFVINTLSTLLPALATIFPDLDQFKGGIKIGLFAPQSDQVFTTYNRALLRLDTDNAEMVLGDPDLAIQLTKPTKYELTNGSYMMGQVASKQSKIESKTYDLVLIEEAQDVDSMLVQKSIEPMVSAVGGTIVKCGTTGTQKNDFWQEIQYNVKRSSGIADKRLQFHLEFNFKAIFASKREQFAIDGKKFHLLYERDVLAKEKKWGRDAQPFRLGYALEWDLDSGMLMSDKLFKKACNRRKGLGTFNDDDIMVAGLDIGKDQSSTIVTIGKVIFNPVDEFGDPDIKKELVDWLELHKVDYETQFNEVVDFLLEYNVSAVTCDYTGVGKPFVDRLRAAVGDVIHIIEYPFSTSSKSDMWLNFLSYFETGRFILPANAQAQKTETWDRFKEQLLNMQKWYNGAYLCAEKGDGFQDDYVDSLGLMLLTDGFEVQEFFEEEGDNPFFDTFAVHQQISDSRYNENYR